MVPDMQNVIDGISESKIKVKKTPKKQLKHEKEYEKELILQEKAKNPNLTVKELSDKFGISKDDVDSLLLEIEEKKKEDSIPKVKKESFKGTKEKIKKIKKSAKKMVDKDDKKTLIEIFLKVLLFGVPLNFSLWCFVYHPFSFYSWLSYGYVFWFIKKEVVVLLRSLWFR